MKMKDIPLCDRPREKLFTKGPENLKDSELLAILFRTGREGKNVLELASDVLKKYPMQKLAALPYEELTKIKGVDIGKAATLISSFELAKRALRIKKSTLPTISNPEDIIDFLSDLRTLKKEHFVALYLNARSQVVLKETISIGTLNASPVHPREVFEPAVRCLAAQIIVAHNHPSGHEDPSDADIEITKKLVLAGNVMGIELVDHVIITAATFFSFRREGLVFS